MLYSLGWSGICHAVQAGFELIEIHLLWPPECWDSRHGSQIYFPVTQSVCAVIKRMHTHTDAVRGNAISSSLHKKSLPAPGSPSCSGALAFVPPTCLATVSQPLSLPIPYLPIRVSQPLVTTVLTPSLRSTFQLPLSVPRENVPTHSSQELPYIYFTANALKKKKSPNNPT